ncbi:MAG TPA: hypothetical protein VMF65_00710, partial [Acidimicrobiales bacterium]|nr:hypothetical protein [Acidimicrobiales bacterium]
STANWPGCITTGTRFAAPVPGRTSFSPDNRRRRHFRWRTNRQGAPPRRGNAAVRPFPTTMTATHPVRQRPGAHTRRARARWNTRKVVVVGLGDRVVMRPAPDEPDEQLEGKYRTRGPSSGQARRPARRDDAARAGAR